MFLSHSGIKLGPITVLSLGKRYWGIKQYTSRESVGQRRNHKSFELNGNENILNQNVGISSTGIRKKCITF